MGKHAENRNEEGAKHSADAACGAPESEGESSDLNDVTTLRARSQYLSYYHHACACVVLQVREFSAWSFPRGPPSRNRFAASRAAGCAAVLCLCLSCLCCALVAPSLPHAPPGGRASGERERAEPQRAAPLLPPPLAAVTLGPRPRTAPAVGSRPTRRRRRSLLRGCWG